MEDPQRVEFTDLQLGKPNPQSMSIPVKVDLVPSFTKWVVGAHYS